MTILWRSFFSYVIWDDYEAGHILYELSIDYYYYFLYRINDDYTVFFMCLAIMGFAAWDLRSDEK
jgi:hypothetical protein